MLCRHLALEVAVHSTEDLASVLVLKRRLQAMARQVCRNIGVSAVCTLHTKPATNTGIQEHQQWQLQAVLHGWALDVRLCLGVCHTVVMFMSHPSLSSPLVKRGQPSTDSS